MAGPKRGPPSLFFTPLPEGEGGLGARPRAGVRGYRLTGLKRHPLISLLRRQLLPLGEAGARGHPALTPAAAPSDRPDPAQTATRSGPTARRASPPIRSRRRAVPRVRPSARNA